MKTSFAARRKPKAIAREQDDDEGPQAQSEAATTCKSWTGLQVLDLS